jgi:hypothetical protein
MKTKVTLILFAAMVLGLVVASMFFKNTTATTVTKALTAAVPTPLLKAEPTPAIAPVETVAPAPTLTEPKNEVAAKVPINNQPSGIKNSKTKDPIQDPTARMALSLVGADPDADAYWVSAINDPSLSANERKDLIEDLNEDGLSDPKHPGADDLPMIWSRINLIEQLGPSAMDQVNAAAFAEAYKDLVNLAMGNGAQ